jgi:excinuclease ABC subunit C
MDESILDDCPGVSRNRKKALLKKFGSVDRIRKATPAEIGELEGMSERFGEGVIAFLEEQERRRKQSGNEQTGKKNSP